MVEPEFPVGQTEMLGVQDGGSEFQVNEAPGGVEEREILVRVPEQIDLVNGGFTAGKGLMVIASDEVGPGLIQFVFVPYTWMLPDVALAEKFTEMKASVGLICVMVAPVPV
jgi:hypothetical protein